LAWLEKVGFNSNSIDMNTKSLIFKAYIRPIVLCLTKNDISNLNRLEGNVMKVQASGLHKPQNWLGETIFFLIALIN
jgi:hypothetical protein